MIQHRTVHDTFVIERRFDAPPSRVFAAFADLKIKQRWFRGPAEWEQTAFEMDFRVGGRDLSKGGPKGERSHVFDARYYDIVPNERIVYAYEMYFDTTRISVSLTTIELKPAGKGTQLTFTEQGVFLDDFDGAKGRKEGTEGLLGQLAAELQRA